MLRGALDCVLVRDLFIPQESERGSLFIVENKVLFFSNIQIPAE